MMAGKGQKPVLVDQLALPAFRRLLSHEQKEIVLRARRIEAGQERPLVDFSRGTYAFLLAGGMVVYMKVLPDTIIIEHIIQRK
jgi:hypothetical protein